MTGSLSQGQASATGNMTGTQSTGKLCHRDRVNGGPRPSLNYGITSAMRGARDGDMPGYRLVHILSSAQCKREGVGGYRPTPSNTLI